ncbi:MAG: PIG-L family deacetylase, partial [Planctomycetota bacterium]
MALCAPASAQSSNGAPFWSGGVVALQQAVEDASNDWQVLLVASHPDDDYLMAAASLRFDYGFRVGVLLATRGEGGQNSEGPETGDALGRLRTREAEASAAELGIRIWYLNRPDGGYCRDAAEALALWGREGTVREMALIIRRVRPDIVLTTHHPRESHGNDLALLDMLPEAVERAGDVELETPELKPVRPRLFIGVAPDDNRDDLDAAIELEMDTMDLARGATYRQIAYETLIRNHKSQRPFRPMGELYPSKLRFVPVELSGRSPAPGLYEDLPTLWNLLPDALADGTSRMDLVQALDVELKSHLGNTSMLVDRAISIYQSLQRIGRQPGSELDLRLGRRLEALQRVIQYGCALQVEVETDGAVAVPGEDLPLRVAIHNGEAKVIENLRIEVRGGGSLSLQPEMPGGGFTVATRQSLGIRCQYRIPASWSGRGNPSDALYRGVDFQWPLGLVVRYRIDGQRFSFPVEIPVQVRPAVEVFCTPRQLLVPTGLNRLKLSVQVRRNTNSPIVTRLSVEAPVGFEVWGEGGNAIPVSMDLERWQTFDFEITVPDSLPTGVTMLRFRLGGEVVSQVRIHRVDVAIEPSLRVGLVRGVENSTEQALRGLGVQLSLLTDEG